MNFGGAIRINKCALLIVLAVGFFIILYAYGGSSNSTSDPSRVFASRNTATVSLRQLLTASVDVAIRGGIEVVKVRRSTATVKEQIKGKTKEGAQDRVTEGDFRSHRVMYYGLRKTFPRIKVISEEHTSDQDVSDIPPATVENDEISKIMIGDKEVDSDDVAVWIDPLDATQEYTENLVEYVTTMVGVAVKGVPIMGVIHMPFKQETYWAVVGYGNSINLNAAMEANRKVNFDNEDAPEVAKGSYSGPLRIVVSRSHAGGVINATAAVLPKDSFKIDVAAGAGYKVLQVLMGKADVYLHKTNIKKWDLCAGNGIINAVSGEMTTLDGEKLDYSADADPLNTHGLLVYVTPSRTIERLRDIAPN